jgi:type I restriction enzyme S subunit
MKWKPYQSYSDSGVDFIGPIPSHWRAHKIKQLADVRLSNVDKLKVDGQATVRLANYTDVYKNERITTSIDLMVATASDDQIEKLALRAQDVLITKDSETPDDIAVPAFVPETMEEVVCGYHLAMLRPDPEKLHGGYLHRWIQGRPSRSYFTIHANGLTRYGIGKGDIGNAPLLWAPMEEQMAIASFLDRETAKIDALIAEQRKLIEQLREKRIATITHVTSNGIIKRPKLKEVETGWINQIPECWNLARLSSLCKFLPGKAHEPFVDVDGEYICVNSRFVSTNGSSIKHCNVNLTPAINDDILIVMSDLPNGRALGKAFHVSDDRKYAVNQRVCIIRPTAISSKFLFYLLDRNRYFLSFDNGVEQTHLSNATFTKMLIPVPPVEEQAEIEERLDEMVGTIESLIAAGEALMGLLVEHRSALITAVVTGKVDVRDAVKESA